MTRRAPALALTISLAFSIVPTGSAVVGVAEAACDPFQTPPVYQGTVPKAETVLGFELGTQEVTVEESDKFLAAVDLASTRVTSGTAATSVEGKPIKFAIVGDPARVTPGGLAAVQAAVAVLRNPLATPARVDAAVAAAPAVLWVAANVHGGEESGADASLRALYELADRTDCVVTDILANALVVILPIQNPDGRELEQRRNVYGFDMNRDWFARTQPETDGKLEVIRQYPPMLFIDAHEFGLSNYFFPPNADPEYHEIPDQAHDWINELYSPAIASEFDRQGIKYFHGAPYDFFAIVFGDTVPTEGFHAAGMTFEKESGDPISEREHEQFTSIWASLYAGASNRESVLRGWHASWAQAYQQGLAGTLEPNAVFEKGHSLYQPVPDLTVRHYFLRDDPNRAAELQLLVRRLQRMDVSVYRLSAALPLSDFHAYGDPAAAVTLPAGTYWIPMAQAQKHWIQAMLHEDSYIPFQVTYDVTAWSNPLLMNLRGGWSGQVVSPSASLVAPVGVPAAPALPPVLPKVGLMEIPLSTRGFEAAGQATYLFKEVWKLPFSPVDAYDIAPGLAGIDVLVIPDGYANYAMQALGAKGKRALREWVNAGGRIVAWQGGVEVAVKAGVSAARLGNANTNMPGTLVRVAVDAASPVAAGVGDRDWVMFQDDRTLRPGGAGVAVATFPAAGSPAYATSGLTIGVSTLAGTAAVVDEPIGSNGGRAVLFSIDPNFRAWTQGTQRLLWNAILGEAVGAAVAPAAGSKERAEAERAAADAASRLLDVGSAIRIRVRQADAAVVAKTLGRHGAEVVRIDLGLEVLFLVVNRKDLSYEEHPFIGLVLRDLDRAGVDILAASVP